MPTDLHGHTSRLKAFKVSPSTVDLRWVSFPRLERLDASYTKELKRLPILPASLHSLDLRSSGVLQGNWVSLVPEGLESLALGGDRVTSLVGLNDRLLELTLDDVPDLTTLEGLPASLQSLNIRKAPKLADLGRLPSRLKELTLDETGIVTLKALPESLRSLTLRSNKQMGSVELTAFLERLSVSGQPLPPMGELAYLRHLEAPALPDFRIQPSLLDTLRISSSLDPRARGTASSLRLLQVAADSPAIFGPEEETAEGSLPALHLEEIHWKGAPVLRGLPSTLRRLSIPYSKVSSLAGLPTGAILTDLDISGTAIRVLPRSLRRLRFSESPYRIGHLPSDLEELDISASPVVISIANLPGGLKRLNASGTRIAELPNDLPRDLEELDVSYTPLTSLRGLAGLKRLRSLTIHGGQFQTLEGLPANVTELYFVEPL